MSGDNCQTPRACAYHGKCSVKCFFSDPDDAHILEVHDNLHKGKLGMHWLWVVIEQVAAGVPEEEALSDYGFFRKE